MLEVRIVYGFRHLPNYVLILMSILRDPLHNINYARTCTIIFVCSDIENHFKPGFTMVF